MDKNEFDWDDNWALLALSAMAASMNKSDNPEEQPMTPIKTLGKAHLDETSESTVDIDKFTIEQLRAATMNYKKEAEKYKKEAEKL